MNQIAQKWGNSLAVRIPKSVSAQAQIPEGTAVTVRAEGETIVIAKARPRRRIDADALIAQITPENLHEPVDFGAPVGNEVI